MVNYARGLGTSLLNRGAKASTSITVPKRRIQASICDEATKIPHKAKRRAWVVHCTQLISLAT